MSERQLIAGEIAGLIAQAETSIDQGCIATSRLSSGVLQGRFDAALSAVVCPDAVADIAAAHAKLFEARAHIVSAHGRLDQLRRALRLQPTTASGSGDKSPYDSFAADDPAHSAVLAVTPVE